MNTPDNFLLDLTGSRPEEIKLLESHQPRDGARGFGFEGYSPDPVTTRDPMNLRRITLETAPDLFLASWNPDPTVFLASAKGVTILSGDCILLDDQDLEIRSSSQRAVLLVDSLHPDVLLLLDLEGGEVRLWSQEIPRTLMESLPKVPHVGIEDIQVPDMERLADGLDLARWLRDMTTSLMDSQSPLATIQGLGLLLRFYRPEHDHAVHRELERLKKGEPPILLQRLRSWASTIPPQAWEQLVEHLQLEVDAMYEELDHLAQLVSGFSGAAFHVASGLVARRDQLESALACLQAAGCTLAPQVAGHLGSLDTHFAIHLSPLGEALDGHSPLSREHMQALARYEPDSWWSVFHQD